MANLTVADVAAFSTAQISVLRVSQVAALSLQGVSALTTAHAQALNTEQIAALNTTQVSWLPVDDIAAMTSTQQLAFSSADYAAMTPAQRDALVVSTPIVLDLGTDGVHTLAASQGVSFDLDATGHATTVGWVAPTAGLLVLDLNHDGRINDGSELFGAATVLPNGQRAGNGFAALAAQDSNHDHRITAADAQFQSLEVWADANHDGKTDAGELKSLAELGIVELDLSPADSTTVDHGNLIGQVSSYKTGEGQVHQMADVWLAKMPIVAHEAAPSAASPRLSELLVAPAADTALPGAPAAPGAVATPTQAPLAHAERLHHGLDDTQQHILI
jgi:hypothetical protein